MNFLQPQNILRQHATSFLLLRWSTVTLNMDLVSLNSCSNKEYFLIGQIFDRTLPVFRILNVRLQHKNSRSCPMTDRYLHHCSTSETKQKYIISHVLTNLKTCNSINPRFVAFLRLPLSIQKYLIAYYTIQYNFSLAIHKNCVYFSLGIRMKDSLNETMLVLLHNMRLPCCKMCNPSAGTR